uniref:G_PROTEIN_RECEP_F1_2 domain-containing protein n=1 Tax=Macrostomum lignano TaxID=282301 RepID=A0A1I8FJ80_9PLAT
MSFMILGYDKSRRTQSSTFYLRALAVADCFALVFNALTHLHADDAPPSHSPKPLNPVSMLVNSFPACNIPHVHHLLGDHVYIIVFFSIERALVLVNPFRWSPMAHAAQGAHRRGLPASGGYVVNHIRQPLYRNDTGETVYSDELLQQCQVRLRHQPDGRRRRGSVSETVFVDGNNGTQPTHSHFGFVYPGEAEQPHSAAVRARHPASFKRSNASRSRQHRRHSPNISGLLGKAEPADLSTAPHSLLPPGIVWTASRVAECRINFAVFKPFGRVPRPVAVCLCPFCHGRLQTWSSCSCSGAGGDGHDLRKASSSGQQSDEQIDRQVTKRLILVSTTYILLSFPLALFHIVHSRHVGHLLLRLGGQRADHHADAELRQFFLLISLSTASAEEQFRRLLASLLHCRQKNFTRMLSYVTRPRQHRHRPGGRPAGAGGGVGGTTAATTDRQTRRGGAKTRRRPARAVRALRPRVGQQAEEGATATGDCAVGDCLQYGLVGEQDRTAGAPGGGGGLRTTSTTKATRRRRRSTNFRNCSLLPEEDDWPSSQQFSPRATERLREGLRSDGQCKGNHGQMEPSGCPSAQRMSSKPGSPPVNLELRQSGSF